MPRPLIDSKLMNRPSIASWRTFYEHGKHRDISQPMTNEQIEYRIGELVLAERALDLELIDLIAHAEDRRIYARAGFGSMFDWLTRYFGLSESSAQRRISASRLVKVIPEIQEKIESGELNLSTICEVQSAIAKEERATGTRMTVEAKKDLLEKANGKSIKQTREMLAVQFPEQAPPEKVRPINADQVTVSFTLTKEQYDLYLQAKAACSNTDPKADMATIAVEGFKTLITAAAKKQSVRRRFLMKRANNQCEWTTPEGVRCESKHQLEEDHIIGRAQGGTDAIENLRMACRTHNQLHAEICYGREKVRQHHKSSDSPRRPCGASPPPKDFPSGPPSVPST